MLVFKGILVLCAVLCGAVDDRIKNLSFEEYSEEILGRNDANAVVLPVRDSDSNNERVVRMLNEMKDEFEKFGITPFTVTCGKSKTGICHKEMKYLALVNKGAEVGPYDIENLQNKKSDITLITQALLGDSILPELKPSDSERFHTGYSGIVNVFICEQGSIDHFNVLRAVKELTDRDENMIPSFVVSDGSIVGIDEKEYKGVKGIAMICDGTKCNVGDISTKSLSIQNVEKFVQDVLDEYSTQSFVDYIVQKVEDGDKKFALFAGKGKNDKALALAEEIKTKLNCEIEVATMDTPYMGQFGHYFENGRIYATYLGVQNKVQCLFNIGALVEESFHEFEAMWQESVNEPQFLQEISTDSDSYIDDETSIMDTLDDPMAFAVHTSKKMRNFYLYDYKTMSRLTDKTFPALLAGDKYGVILVTLEFNARALAALALYKEIFDTIGENGDNSYMHRVECFDWPDVCAKMNVTTSPRMFFHKPNSENLKEYTGMWTKKEMTNAIIRYCFRNSMDDVVIVNTMDELDTKVPTIQSLPMVIGIFLKNDGGCEQFKEASMKNDDVLFVQAKNEAARELVEEIEGKIEHKSIVAYQDMNMLDIMPPYESVEDISNFIKNVFYPIGGQLFELKLTNYNEVLSNEKPLFIHFRNASSPSDEKWMELLGSIADDKKVDSKYYITWMESEKDTTGFVISRKYNINDYPALAYFDKKGSVFYKPLTGMSADMLIKWADQCDTGKEKSIFKLSNKTWEPRLDGYDFLQKMKDDNTYPVNFRNPKLRKEIEEQKEKSGGRLKQKVAKEVAKSMKKNEKMSHTEL